MEADVSSLNNIDIYIAQIPIKEDYLISESFVDDKMHKEIIQSMCENIKVETPDLKSVVEVGEVTIKTEICDIGGIIESEDFPATPPHDSSNKRHEQKILPPVKPAICPKCNTGFPTTDLYERHIITAHKDDRPFSCSFCGKRFIRKAEMQTHEKIHDPDRFKGPPKYACDMCDKRYHIRVSLHVHRNTVHLGYKPPKRNQRAPTKQHHSTKGIKNPHISRKPASGPLKCPHCDLEFPYISKLNIHLACHAVEKTFKCQICEYPFASQKRVDDHIRKTHKRASTRPKNPSKCQASKPHPCEICAKVFKNSSQLRHHMTLHTGEKPHKCTSCSRRFRTPASLKIHKLSHQPPNWMHTYKCRFCGKDGIKTRSNLKNHRGAVHKSIPFGGEKEKPFACGICGKPYYSRIQAVICALLGHDPTPLQNSMFKHKCPECPYERLGYHHLHYLRKHWEIEHPDKILPADMRIGMHSDNLKPDDFPSVAIDQKKKNAIIENGPPKSEFALFVELDLLETPEADKKISVFQNLKNLKCDICDLSFSNGPNLRRHLKFVHDPSRPHRVKRIGDELKCSICKKIFDRLRRLQTHARRYHNLENPPDIILDAPNEANGESEEYKMQRSRRGRLIRVPKYLQSTTNDATLAELATPMEQKTDVISGEESNTCQIFQNEDLKTNPNLPVMKCRFCPREFCNLRARGIHELRMHTRTESWAGPTHTKVNKRRNRSRPFSASQNAKVDCTDQTQICDIIKRSENQFSIHSTVKVTDKKGIHTLLGGRGIHIKLARLDRLKC